MKTLYKYGKSFDVEEYSTVEAGIEAEMSHGESSALFLVGKELWSLERVTPYGATELSKQGFKQFTGDIMGMTTGYFTYPTTPTTDTELI